MRLATHAVPIVAVALSLAALAVRAAEQSLSAPEAKASHAPEPARAKAEAPLVQAQPPPFSEGIFPCSGCHSDPGDRTRRQLGFHEEIQEVFDHDSDHRWCLDCHDAANRDVLKLASGDTVPFTESYRLCGQCHGDKYRDWRAGVHGKRVGQWDAEKTYFLCVNCHNPHTPSFKGVKEIEVDGKRTTAPTLQLLRPEPRPLRPEEMRGPPPGAAKRATATAGAGGK
ncbi:hypothetical protein [Anaeromyxobacter sp. Fw109-5]|uniref:hypothetical protein n=1 Tax=Anaeromyxobacter sp. (strain Fw109-5) TaxID=404589 RepID=UPI0000ED7378|nr:hypothetical protein [Anaeromyxobacter sp. Fw109-5]ABS26609.1 conserved hypothetical protein [Anaeromyxobacter sp. Fw109-5]